MHAVCLTHAFLKAVKDLGLSEKSVDELVSYLAGEEIVGTGGCRKLRWGLGGKGKRGGMRTITFYSGDDLPSS